VGSVISTMPVSKTTVATHRVRTRHRRGVHRFGDEKVDVRTRRDRRYQQVDVSEHAAALSVGHEVAQLLAVVDDPTELLPDAVSRGGWTPPTITSPTSPAACQLTVCTTRPGPIDAPYCAPTTSSHSDPREHRTLKDSIVAASAKREPARDRHVLGAGPHTRQPSKTPPSAAPGTSWVGFSDDRFRTVLR